MPAYIVQRDRTKSGYQMVNQCDAVVVFAADAAQARAIAASVYGGDGGAWAEASVTAVAAQADLAGVRFRIALFGTAIDVSVIGAASDTWDGIGAKLVTALNNTVIDNAAYNSTTNVLTVAGTADNLGNKSLIAEVYLPGCTEPMPGIFSALVSDGVASAAVTVTLPADGTAVPTLISRVRSEA